jgi:hypothetical protein
MYSEIITLYFISLALVIYLKPGSIPVDKMYEYKAEVIGLNIILFCVGIYPHLSTSSTCIFIGIMISAFIFTLYNLFYTPQLEEAIEKEEQMNSEFGVAAKLSDINLPNWAKQFQT